MSQSLDSDRNDSQQLYTTSARLIAIKIRSANKHIFRALLSLASANLLIRIIGLLNQTIVSAKFGQDQHMDAYYVAALIPITLAPMLASALEASVIPVYTRLRTRGSREQVSKLFSTLLNLLIISSILFTIILLIFKTPLLGLIDPGSQHTEPHAFIMAQDLAPFIFPVLGLMTINSFMECLLNAEGKFGWPAYAGLFVPLTTATCVLIGGNSLGVFMLCIGSIIGQLLQLGIIIYRAHKTNIIYQPVMDFSIPELKPIMNAAWPALFAGVISMASPVVDTFFGSYQPEGTITALNNALKLNSVPTGVLFAAVGRAALPYLANQAAIKDMKAFKGTLRLYLWIVGLGTFLLTAVMTFGAWPIVFIIFKHGQFNIQDVNRTSWILTGLSLGMFPMAIGFVVSRAFSALGHTRILMGVSIFSIFANAAFDAFFGNLWGGFGIAFATSSYYFCTMIILIVILRLLIGKLNLLTPPKELRDIVKKIGMGYYYLQWIKWKDRAWKKVGFTYAFRKQLMRIVFILVVFVGGAIATIENATLALRVAGGSVIILLLLRYQYALLLAWACINVFIGSSLPFFNGNNLLSGLTVPTLILLFILPTKEALGRMPALSFWLAYFLWVLLSIGISPIPLQAFLISWTSQLDFFAVSILVIILIDSRRKLLGFIDAMIAPAIFIALYGLWGFSVQQNGVIDTITGFFRISSIFMDTPPTLGLYLSILIPITIYRLFTLRGFFKLCSATFILLLLLLALGLTFNRGTLLALTIGLIISVLLLPSNRIKAIAIGAGTVLIGFIFLGTTLADIPLLSRFANSDITSLNGRTYLWQAIIDHFDPTQILGNGMQSSDILLANLRVGSGGNVIATAAHNIYLEAMYEHGIIGLALLLLALISVAYLLLRKYRLGSYEQKLLLAIAIGTFLSVIIQCYESNDIWNQGVGIYFFIFMALPFSRYWDNVHKQKRLSQEEQGLDGTSSQQEDRYMVPDKEEIITT